MRPHATAAQYQVDFAEFQAEVLEDASSTEPLGSLILPAYLGTWYEIARLPADPPTSAYEVAARYCINARAEYLPLDHQASAVSVRNSCITASGDSISIEGEARPDGPNSFFVTFPSDPRSPVPPPQDQEFANYFVLAVDPYYRWALVSSHPAVLSSREDTSAWILARTPVIPPGWRTDFPFLMRRIGFSVDQTMRLLFRDPSSWTSTPSS